MGFRVCFFSVLSFGLGVLGFVYSKGGEQQWSQSCRYNQLKHELRESRNYLSRPSNLRTPGAKTHKETILAVNSKATIRNRLQTKTKSGYCVVQDRQQHVTYDSWSF